MQQILIVKHESEIEQHLHLLAPDAKIILDAWGGGDHWMEP